MTHSLSSIDVQPMQHYYPKKDSPDAEDIALIHRVHEVYVRELIERLLMEDPQHGFTLTFSKQIEISIPLTRLDSHFKQHIFSKKYGNRDLISVELNVPNVIRRIDKALQEQGWEPNSYSLLETDIENLTEQKKIG